MRKILEALALVALVLQAVLTWKAFLGPDRLPARVPLHFDLAGNPDGWGTPATLLYFPGIAVFIYLLFTVVTRFPSAFNYPVRVTPQNRARLEALALEHDCVAQGGADLPVHSDSMEPFGGGTTPHQPGAGIVYAAGVGGGVRHHRMAYCGHVPRWAGSCLI